MNLLKYTNCHGLNFAPRPNTLCTDPVAMMLSRTLHNEPSLVYTIPDEESRRIVLPSLFLSAIRAGKRSGEIRTTKHGEGAAVWIRPEHEWSHRQMVRAG